MDGKGYTFLECIITVAILAILCGAMYKPMTGFRESVRLKSEVSHLVSNLTKAKLIAIKNNCCVVVDFSIPGQYTIFSDNGLNGGIRKDWVRQSGEKSHGSYEFGDWLMVATNFHAPLNKVRFKERGSISGGSIFLESEKGGKYKVVLSSIGRIRSLRLE